MSTFCTKLNTQNTDPLPRTDSHHYLLCSSLWPLDSHSHPEEPRPQDLDPDLS